MPARKPRLRPVDAPWADRSSVPSDPAEARKWGLQAHSRGLTGMADHWARVAYAMRPAISPSTPEAPFTWVAR